MGTFKILGVTDAHDQCDKCGKSGLKKTWHIETDEGCYHLGSTCVKQAFQMTAKELGAMEKSEAQRRLNEANAEWAATDSCAFLKGFVGTEKQWNMLYDDYEQYISLTFPHEQVKRDIAAKHNVNFRRMAG